MKKLIYFNSIFIILFFINCKDIKNNDRKETKYKIERIRYNLGINSYQDVQIYISKENDTIGNQTKTYQNNKLDSTRSTFYSLDLSKTINKKTSEVYSLQGTLKYHFDSIEEGKLIEFFFMVNTKNNNQEEKKNFENYDFKNNEIEFSFDNQNDTLMGVIYAQHLKDSVYPGEKSGRFREITIVVDNHLETNNPFVGK